MVNAGKYTSPMDAMGMSHLFHVLWMSFGWSMNRESSKRLNTLERHQFIFPHRFRSFSVRWLLVYPNRIYFHIHIHNHRLEAPLPHLDMFVLTCKLLSKLQTFATIDNYHKKITGNKLKKSCTLQAVLGRIPLYLTTIWGDRFRRVGGRYKLPAELIFQRLSENRTFEAKSGKFNRRKGRKSSRCHFS